MVQVLKDSVRRQIATAAELQFAQAGFAKATMGAIAREAGVATGTIYTYFADKDELFQAILPPAFVAEFSRLTRARIAAFARPGGLRGDQTAGDAEAGELLRFWTRNRHKTIILLARAEGTPYADFARDYIREMASQTERQAREQFPQLAITDLFRFMVTKILSDSVRGIVAILQTFDNEAAITEAFAASSAYQLAGINAFIQWNLRAEQA